MPTWKHHRPKPVIGIAGGIGSGKSTVARLFESQGCAVIDSDRLAHDILQSAEVKAQLRPWLGEGVFNPDGSVNRRAVGQRIFADKALADRLNSIIHPRVDRARDILMSTYMANGSVKAVIWDSPLLFEAGLADQCDALVFVNVPRDIRLQRLRQSRGWTEQELDRREKLQIPLDKKAKLADYCIDNSTDQASTLRLVQQVLSQLLAQSV